VNKKSIDCPGASATDHGAYFTSHCHFLRIVTFELNFYTFIFHQLQLSVCYEKFGPGSGDGGSSVYLLAALSEAISSGSK
jgi:hypothetical protein